MHKERDERFVRACYNATHPNQKAQSMSTTLTIRIDDALERELKRVAAATHRPKGDIVREALRRQLALARFRSVRGEVMRLAEQRGLLTDEDVFKAVS